MTPQEKKELLKGFRMDIRKLHDGYYLVMKDVPEGHPRKEELEIGNMVTGDDFIILFKLK